MMTIKFKKINNGLYFNYFIQFYFTTNNKFVSYNHTYTLRYLSKPEKHVKRKLD